MYFLDPSFLGFVPAVVAVYWLSGRARPVVLLAGSALWLYLFSRPTLIALPALVAVVIYPAALVGARFHAAGRSRAARTAAWIGIVALIVIASVLRLRDLLLANVGLSLSPTAGQLLHWIGFSYLLLKGIHAIHATSRGLVRAPTLLELLDYMLFLPTLTSGPIYRLDTFLDQLAAPKAFGWADLQAGALRVVHGLAKKVIAVPALTAGIAWLRAHGIAGEPPAFVVTYVMLYLDFSGYCDIAIGLGRLLGFAVPENFKNPFTATTLTQFWRNWHATLGDWLRENVFIPLGGVRAKGWQLSVIVLGSMLLVGLWHGYRLVFVAWGAYHGVLLLVENRLGVAPLRKHRTPKWRLYARYALVQALVIGGMFAFLSATAGCR